MLYEMREDVNNTDLPPESDREKAWEVLECTDEHLNCSYYSRTSVPEECQDQPASTVS